MTTLASDQLEHLRELLAQVCDEEYRTEDALREACGIAPSKAVLAILDMLDAAERGQRQVEVIERASLGVLKSTQVALGQVRAERDALRAEVARLRALERFTGTDTGSDA